MSTQSASSASVIAVLENAEDRAMVTKALATSRAWEWKVQTVDDLVAVNGNLKTDHIDFLLVVVRNEAEAAARISKALGRIGPELGTTALMLVASKDVLGPVNAAVGEYLADTLTSESATAELLGRVARACVERKRFAVAAQQADGEAQRLKAMYDKLLRTLGHDVKTAVCVIRLTLDDLTRQIGAGKPELIEVIREVRQETEVIVKAMDEARSISSGVKDKEHAQR